MKISKSERLEWLKKWNVCIKCEIREVEMEDKLWCNRCRCEDIERYWKWKYWNRILRKELGLSEKRSWD